MISTSGSQLLPEAAVQGLRKKLLPLTTVLTPNIPEATLLLKDAGLNYTEPQDLQGLIDVAKQVATLGPKAVLLKGGHLPLTNDHKTARSPDEASDDRDRQKFKIASPPDSPPIAAKHFQHSDVPYTRFLIGLHD